MYKIMIEIERTSGNTVTKQWVNMLGKTLTDAIIDPTVDLALNKAGKAEFTVPASHPHYSDIKSMKTHVEIFETEVVNGATVENSIFYGRVKDITKDWYNQKKVTCEGALAFFNDSVQKYKRYSAATTELKAFFKDVIDRHNALMTDNSKKFYMDTNPSDVDKPDYYINLKDPENKNQRIDTKKVFRITNYESTIDVLTEMCLESEGGYFIIFRKEENGERHTYIKWRSDIEDESTQKAQFGLNLLELNQNYEMDDIYTALIPLGAEYDVYDAVSNPSGNPSEKGWYVKNEDDTYSQAPNTDNPQEGVTYYVKGSRPLTIKSINDNKDYIADDSAVAEYGLIFKTKKWDDVTSKNNLKKKALQWLKTERFNKLVIECNIADLSSLNDNYQPLKIGTNVQIISEPHHITAEDNVILPITEMSYDLNNGKKEVTIGTREQVTLSRITKDGKTKEVRIADARYDPGFDFDPENPNN